MYTKINRLQIVIMEFVDDWARTEKTPVPINEILDEAKKTGASHTKAVRAVRNLVKKQFIRKSVDRSCRSSYVQIRRI